jgi:hypothetical protein
MAEGFGSLVLASRPLAANWSDGAARIIRERSAATH